MKERIAVFGMGQMGANMASRLTEQGFDVLGYDINVNKIPWIQKLNISVYGRNLAILYRDKSTAELGIDPEVGMGGGDSGVGFENSNCCKNEVRKRYISF